MAAGPLSVSSNASTNNDGILIGDKVYAEVFLTIDNSLIPDERLSPTPSMLDGLDLNTETDLRILGCELIQSAGILLRLPQVCLSRATDKRTLLRDVLTPPHSEVRLLFFKSFWLALALALTRRG